MITNPQTRQGAGESYHTMLWYTIPELISASILMSSVIDAKFIAQLNSTVFYATIGVTSVLIQLLIKAAEGVGVGAVILCGQYNGTHEKHKVGHVARHAFILATAIGCAIAALLYIGAHYIYATLGVNEALIAAGTPYLRLRAISIALMFMVSACIGCMRGIKNTRIPMLLFIAGSIIFIIADYACIFGKWGLPALGLQGSAWAAIMQYSGMLLLCGWYIARSSIIREYQLLRWDGLNWSTLWTLSMLSWPVIIDKAALAAAKLWIVAMLTPLGTHAISSFTAIKDLEQIAFIPAIAGAQVITFLVSNARATQSWAAIRTTILRMLNITILGVLLILTLFCLYRDFFIGLFDHQRVFSYLATTALPILSILVIFDVFQIILAGSLRGAADVMTVMWTRLIVLSTFVIPASYIISTWQSDWILLKFILIYSSFYLGNGIMSVIYWLRLTRYHARKMV